MTTAYPGPSVATFDRQTIDNSKRPNNKSEAQLKPSQEPEHGTSVLSEGPKTYKTQTDATTHGLPHYPMDPGHPTVPYNGPYSPDYVSTHPTVEDVFHLSPHSDKPLPTPKEKSKSKADSKKPVEPVKPHKETDQYFPGPLAPNRFPDKTTSVSYPTNENRHPPGPINPTKFIPQQKVHPADQPQFVPLNPHVDASGPGFSFASNNRESIPPSGLDTQLGRPGQGQVYQGPVPLRPDTVDPNIIIPVTPKKKITSGDTLLDAEKSKPSPPLPGRAEQGQRNPNQEILPDQLYHLINLQHPGLIQLEHGPPQDPGLYDLHQQIFGQKQPPSNRAQPGYFDVPPSAPKKPAKPPKNEHEAQIIYHTANVPNSPQHIEELLAHISQHDPNPGPFQHYPERPAVPHNLPGNPLSNLPLHVDAEIPQSGLAHLNLPYAAQTPNQSGSFLIRRDNVRGFRNRICVGVNQLVQFVPSTEMILLAIFILIVANI